MKKAGVFLLPDADTYFAPFLESGGFQIDHLRLALSFVPKDRRRIAVDGGAHVGTWTAEMSRHFKVVHAFEPAEDTFNCLRENLSSALNVTIHRMALGAQAGGGAIVDDPTRVGNTGSRYLSASKVGDVPIKALDDLAMEGLDFLKLDVEGFEYFALLGAERTVRRDRPVVLVEEKGFGDRYGLKPRAASTLLESWGARVMARAGKDVVFKFD
jgi:FkbM family methyltransferase